MPKNPFLRKKICNYHPSDRDQIQRAYLQIGACQPFEHDFPKTKIGKTIRRFNPTWFKEYKWLEYSVLKDAAYCLYCYLFKPDIGNQARGDTFVIEGFSNWKKKEKIEGFMGAYSSYIYIFYNIIENFVELFHSSISCILCSTLFFLL